MGVTLFVFQSGSRKDKEKVALKKKLTTKWYSLWHPSAIGVANSSGWTQEFKASITSVTSHCAWAHYRTAEFDCTVSWGSWKSTAQRWICNNDGVWLLQITVLMIFTTALQWLKFRAFWPQNPFIRDNFCHHSVMMTTPTAVEIICTWIHHQKPAEHRHVFRWKITPAGIHFGVVFNRQIDEQRGGNVLCTGGQRKAGEKCKKFVCQPHQQVDYADLALRLKGMIMEKTSFFLMRISF